MSWRDVFERLEGPEKAEEGKKARPSFEQISEVSLFPDPQRVNYEKAPTLSSSSLRHLVSFETLQDLFEERAAIIEFEGNISREEAELLAKRSLLN